MQCIGEEIDVCCMVQHSVLSASNYLELHLSQSANSNYMKALPIQLSLLLLLTVSLSQAQQPVNQRQLTLLEKYRRPNDFWPRGDGHIVLAEPGSPLSQKAYYEPGGSFSPSPGSFGLAIWVMDKSSKVIATSDNIPMENIQQGYSFDAGDIPSIKAATAYYDCEWKYADHGSWQLLLKNKDAGQYSLAVVIRSAGPAGGPLNSVAWDSTRLLINRQWIVQSSEKPSGITNGNEKEGELQKDVPYKAFVANDEGWAFSKLIFNRPEFSVTLTDTKPQYSSVLPYKKIGPQFEIDLPDQNFVHSLKSQIATLMMGYIGKQTGPGEPVNYPLAWERDGAYSLAAMAKSGNLQTAKELSKYFAENDFFGGFGSEGDAPGSAINALTEVAFLLNDPEYFKWVWPHIKRKLAIIDEMMNADTNIYKNFVGPLVPPLEADIKRRKLICLKTADSGVIMGTMDLHFPALYITSISYRGLVQASRLAGYFKENELASECVEKAAKLQAAWRRNFGKPKYDNERNFMISIWPSWMTNKSNALFKEKILAKHTEDWGDGNEPKERPLWTYFSVSEAHQWLFMDEPDYTWKTMHYFWNNQCAPGFYTYWEGNGEENTFRQWEHYRGWLQPKYVTPHYWTASEMTLLQLDMLVYVNESKPDFELVIGAGVPAEWLTKYMSVKNYRTKTGMVSWEYKNNTLNVTVKGAVKKYAVRAGVNFEKAGTKLNVVYK